MAVDASRREEDEMESQQRIAKVIKEFDGQGWHRTGTDVDAASGEWLRAQLEDAGLEATLETYPFVRLDIEDCHIEIAGRRLEALPLFDGGVTPPAGVRGKLGLPGQGTDICLVSAVSGGPAPALDEAREGGYKAIISVTTGGRPGLAPRNAEAYGAPSGPPVLQVSSADGPLLQRLADEHAELTVVASSTLRAVTASNVLGAVPGADLALPPIIVMTPRSGWWECASERGGGIACWLEIARGIAAADLPRTVIFVATTAHELGYWGLAQFLATRPKLAEGAQLWLHLGASIGAALTPRPWLFASSDAFESLALEALWKADAPQVTPAPRGTRPGGESRNIHDAAGPYISFAGGSEVFHLQSDRWPEAVSVESVAAIARACISIVTQVATR
jgi:hypothetical protein